MGGSSPVYDDHVRKSTPGRTHFGEAVKKELTEMRELSGWESLSKRKGRGPAVRRGPEHKSPCRAGGLTDSATLSPSEKSIKY